MSAPKTDLDKQEKRHRGALTGIGTVVIFALLLLATLLFFLSADGNEPEGAEVQIDGRTGTELPAETE
ncbi:hypothetical protein SAMN05428995_102102 [Loktanella sp. DSM 29012]|uniref:Uncharacterized protein n=1 Tax=Loktanella gaetbuli TaxID=2881335 RepID=A0ABS8BQ90_9RHOB|nr:MULTISPECIES: hypothetical protein [Loktanella]MCB5197661.1 hypothetical protein [Loktanella gaetbuli]SEP94582.1 hypothetical protein SAMN05428995_102102 [Loktanella sp. DSM 29012]